MLKFAGTASARTPLYQKPGEIGGPASREGDAALGDIPVKPFQQVSFMTSSAGNDLYNWQSEKRCDSDRIFRRDK
jgi:hypothetical protein